MKTDNSTTLVFDLPTRIFHWLFAFGFVGAFAIGKFTDDESALYPLHMFFGALMAFAVVLRIIWGFVGSKYARFNSFELNPLGLIEYFKGNFSKTIGRNPASSFAAISMMVIALIIPVTGYMMLTSTSRDQMHNIKEVHEIIATVFAIIAGLHIVGIIFHTATKHEPIGIAMLSGRKNSVSGEVGIPNSFALIGALFIALIGGAAFALNSNYNAQAKTFQFGAKTLVLGENEGAEGEEGEEAEEHEGKNSKAIEREENEEDEKAERMEYNSKNGNINSIAPNMINQNPQKLDANGKIILENEKAEHEKREKEERNEKGERGEKDKD
ncbi:MAG: cytochrome b/b6 domain-containing protein [Caulobacterales bacterium]|nr:cytochrome b/b6 domain-containing protein [Caulobacterales bacterium]MCA0371489.1 cytochrome b/b6 domain-containing protein [Pseudomonadota bacterium]